VLGNGPHQRQLITLAHVRKALEGRHSAEVGPRGVGAARGAWWW
jgi:hypothetical protein